MRTDLTNPYNEALSMLKTWRGRYSKIEYPFKVVLNMFYRQYTMNSIWSSQLDDSFIRSKGKEENVLNAFQILEEEYSMAFQQFTVGNKLVDLMNQKEDIGGLNYRNSIPLISKSQNGDNSAIEEIEFTYLYYFLCNKAVLMWAAYGRKGFSKIEAIAQVTGVIIEVNQSIIYSEILGILGQLGCSETMNTLYSPLPNFY